jgi:hypothetical protein
MKMIHGLLVRDANSGAQHKDLGVIFVGVADDSEPCSGTNRNASTLACSAVELIDTNGCEVGLNAGSVNPAATERRVFARLSIAVGNILQVAGILAACFALSASRSAHSTSIAVITMVRSLWVALLIWTLSPSVRFLDEPDAVPPCVHSHQQLISDRGGDLVEERRP